jgi:hypothetical protein
VPNDNWQVIGGRQIPDVLLAAAPELLNALKVIVYTDHIVTYLEDYDPKALAQVRAAIDKAEGV